MENALLRACLLAVLLAGCAVKPVVPGKDGGHAGTDAGQREDAGRSDDAGEPEDAGEPLDAGLDAGAGLCEINHTVHSGDATYYMLGDSGTATTCFTTLPAPGLFRAALAPGEYDMGNLCGACAQVTGDAGTALVFLDDECPDCMPGSLDLSQEAFHAVTGAVGRGHIEWSLVPCPVEGAIGVAFSNSNDYFLSLKLVNHRNPVTSVTLQRTGLPDAPLTRSFANDFELSSGGPFPAPYSLKVTDAFSQTVTLTVPGHQDHVLYDGGAQLGEQCAP